MHLFCITRGEQSAVRNCMHDLSAQFWLGKCNDALKKDFPQLKGSDTKHMQTIVQPIQLWSIVVPETDMPTLQNTILTNDFERYHTKKDALLVAGLRKMLRAKKCPPLDPKGVKRIIRKEGVEFLPIGIKEDGYTSGYEAL